MTNADKIRSIEKLIEGLKSKDFERDYDYTPFECGVFGLLDDAATALSMLQTENQALRNAANRFKAENEKLRADIVRFNDLLASYQNVLVPELRTELERVKRCIKIVEKQRDAAIEELENYMVQDVLDGNEPCGICAKASDTPCECCDPKWRGPKEG